ncbi:hypothetical protein HYW18_02775 [Candidatus Uhrbacteria bacterium]|nr:hypothetical protein [Candidatus Uhrbacteria bacterium]
MVYLVSYDLGQPNRDYKKLVEKIKSYGTWAKPLESLWLIKTDVAAVQVANDLKTVMDKDDGLVVIQVKSNWSTFNVSQEVTKWMNENIA